MSGAEIIGGLAALSFLAVSSFTGFRLLRTWMRTQQTPELAIGIGLLGTGPFGFGLSIAAEFVGDENLAALLRLAAIGIVSIASIGFVAFTVTVFRPGARWAKTLMMLGVSGFSALYLLSWLDYLWLGPNQYDPAMLPRSVFLTAGWAWMGIECLREARQSRRRAAIGLASPLVANRFLLWGIVSVESVLNNSISTVLSFRAGGNASGTDLVLLTTGLLGLVGSVAIFLAFLPPARYRDWVQSSWDRRQEAS